MPLMPDALALDFDLAYLGSEDIARWIRKYIGHLKQDLEQECRNKFVQICKREAKTSNTKLGELPIACVIEGMYRAPRRSTTPRGCQRIFCPSSRVLRESRGGISS